MPQVLFILAASVLVVLSPGLALARGGGGCLKAGTLVTTPEGERPVERLRVGDQVLTASQDTRTYATVQDVMHVEPGTFWKLVVNGHQLELTGEHPVQTGPGEFCIVSHLKPGDAVTILEQGRPVTGTVESLAEMPATGLAWNLLVTPGGTYFGSGIAVHNKGCFLPDTPVEMEDGSERAISAIRPGDRVLAFDSDGSITNAPVQEILTHSVSNYVVVTTRSRVLRVTSEHPFYMGGGRFKTLEHLQPGDPIYIHNGTSLLPEPIISLTNIRAAVLVYNLHTAPPHTFLAHGAAVHNKGGGGHSSSHHSSSHHSSMHHSSHHSSFMHLPFFHGSHTSSGTNTTSSVTSVSFSSDESDSPGFSISFAGLAMTLFFIAYAKSRKKKELDHLYTESQISAKRDKTAKLLQFIAKQDQTLDPGTLTKVAQNTFCRLQECWQARQYEPMRPLLMPDLHADHVRQLEGMKHHHEINKLDALCVKRVDLVNVRYTRNIEQREFTALITASARDYYVDDQTGRKTRGDDAPATFQEFWTFQYSGRSWLLREIEQSGESAILKEDNFFEPFTETGVNQVYGDLAGKQGAAGPMLEKDAGLKATKIDRLLNFLVQTDPLWDRTLMQESSRRVFLEVMTAWESGNPDALRAEDLFPALQTRLQAQMETNRKAGLTLEFRNLCVRKVELVLVRNRDDNGDDEFVARVRAHAQRMMLRKGEVHHADDDVTLFEQYVTMGRLRQDGGVAEKQWRLKELMSAEEAAPLVGQENEDQGTGADLLNWFYSQKRAN